MKSLRILLCVLVIGIGLTAMKNNPKSNKDTAFQNARMHMVDIQIKRRGINDKKVLLAMQTVPRHEFVPSSLRSNAYTDQPLPIGHNQTISQPYIVAYMTEALQLKGSEKVLEIGTGSGYQAAVLAEIVDSVYTIEIIEPLALQAEKTLKSLGYKNVICRTGDGYRGWPEAAPFDAIIVTAAPTEIPQPLIDQLKDKGRLVVPVGTYYQELILITKENGKPIEKHLLPVRFVPMTGEVQDIEK